jgi:RNA polymerase sigma factor (sigma-70 family)
VSLLDALRHDASARDAWAALVRLYAPLLVRWARGHGLQPADADGLAQDAFLHLYRGLPRFEHRGPGSFRAWLWAVCRHRWADRARLRSEHQPADGHDTAAPAPPPEAEGWRPAASPTWAASGRGH